ncbi:TPA: deoxycytidine deaminase [Citrobacter freundii]|uniref:dCTP deaminase n=1 Tax=Citrobacter TaxID=544 RepID=UPI00155DE8DB|nr:MULTISPECIES: deoxycytidine deaminase [Citrobacter]EKU2180282.1 hypothetical protein [Citrobacter freundii]EKY0311748.1 hypothetical protein [Citrobacter freundii]EKY0667469.1 hypothetical protein [Citrobacter freundii]MBA7991195.1 deoxycytidine deaminase [Citrobacter freundii]MBJ9088775.1 hypothetical protein [Citrobacter freundii]
MVYLISQFLLQVYYEPLNAFTALLRIAPLPHTIKYSIKSIRYSHLSYYFEKSLLLSSRLYKITLILLQLVDFLMILSIKSHIHYLISEGYISNVNAREIDNSEGVGLDLSISEVYEIEEEDSMLGVVHRKTPPSRLIPFNDDGYLSLNANTQYLIKTVESFNLPEGICCNFYPRSTLFRSGIIFQSSILSTGYNGNMIFSISNFSKNAMWVERDARFATAVFMAVDGDVNKYRGQWNGSRVSQPISERQV